MDINHHNRCNLPPRVIASRHFNRSPETLEIQGTTYDQRVLLEKLQGVNEQEARGALFHDFMDVRFQLHQWQRESSVSSRKSLKNSYLRFLRGWLFDSNSVEGAVLKGWVESRFGLPPTYHQGTISSADCPTYLKYRAHFAAGAIRTNAILSQLDLLYAFVQNELKRLFPGTSHLGVYRGIYDYDEHLVLEKIDKTHQILMLNNLNSFTGNFERAWEFGTRVLQVQVPLCKIAFLSGLLPKALFKGEEEILVIGGEYEVKVLIGG